MQLVAYNKGNILHMGVNMNRVEKEQFIFGSILLLANKLQIFGDKLFTDFTLKQWFLIIMMSKMENKEPTVREISDFTGTTRQNVKKMLLPLENKGFVAVEKSATDGRALKVSLTDKSYQYFNDHKNDSEIIVDRIFTAIGEEDLDTVIRVFNALFATISNIENNEVKI